MRHSLNVIKTMSLQKLRLINITEIIEITDIGKFINLCNLQINLLRNYRMVLEHLN